MARQLQQRRSICSFNALSSIRRMAAGDRETAAAENTEATWERRNGRESAELWVLIRCRGWSMARRASSLIHQQREVAEGEEIWGSCGEWASYIARYPAHLRGLRGFYSHRFYSHIGSFLKHSTHHRRAVTMCYWKRLQLLEKNEFSHMRLKEKMQYNEGNGSCCFYNRNIKGCHVSISSF